MSVKHRFHPGRYREMLCILLLACFGCRAVAQNIQVETKLDKTSMPLGAQTVLHVAAHFPFKSTVSFPLLKDSIGKIKIVKGPRPDSAADKNNSSRKTVSYNYILTSFDTGVYIIPALEFHTSSGVLKTDPLSLHIRPVLVDTTKSFYDIKQPFVVSYTFWDWLKDHWVLVLVILAGVLLVSSLVYFLKNRSGKGIITEAALDLTPHEIAIKKLNELRDKNLWQQNQVKLYYVELTDILREYLEKRYYVQAQEQTTADIIISLNGKLVTGQAVNSLRQLLMLADLVKFAKENPLPAANEQCMEDAVDFVSQTKEQIRPVQEKEELPG